MGLFDKIKQLIKKDITNIQKDELKAYDEGLSKTRNQFYDLLKKINNNYQKINEDYFEELENVLISADIGISTINKFMVKIKDRIKKENITSPESLEEIIVDELFIIYVGDDYLSSKLNYATLGPTVILVVGVNGVGKTTTIAKLAYIEKQKGKKVLLVAADTFRAGATEQLEQWGHKIGVDIVKKDTGFDPSSVVYEGVTKAVSDNYDIVLIDTAGRLQNKQNLMQELEKMNRVISKIIPSAPHETLLVIDASTGQNGISQAKSFMEITNLTGLVLTKLDGTAKGGIVLAIKEATNLPVKYIGLGEKETDLKNFDIENYIYGLFKDSFNKK